MFDYAAQLCTQMALAMAVRTVTTKLMIFLMFSLFIAGIIFRLVFYPQNSNGIQSEILRLSSDVNIMVEQDEQVPVHGN